MKFYTQRGIFSAIGIVAAPFVIFIVIFAVVHSIAYDGTGPDDGAGILAAVVSLPVALLTAVSLWTVSLIRFIVWVGNRESTQNCQ